MLENLFGGYDVLQFYAFKKSSKMNSWLKAILVPAAAVVICRGIELFSEL